MMRELQSFTLSICVLCTMAGLIRLLSPSGGFRAVINCALLLYILATGLQMAHNADWPSFARQMYRWRTSESATASDYSAYANEVLNDATAAEIEKTLRDGGVKAEVKISGNECTIRLSAAEELTSARVLLEAQSNTLQYRFEVQRNDG